MLKKFPSILISLFALHGFGQIQDYFLKNKTPEYQQVIRFYDSIARKCPFFKWMTCGKTDVGKPLNLLVISKDKKFDPASIHAQQKVVLLITNGIHPGEPDGIDACISLVREFASNPRLIPDSVVICIVPVYNIDGALQRNSVMRMNQNGPEEFGFRGNGKNLDLNRDFIKCDAENTRSLIRIFHEWKPEVLVDTHVSNGADYQYTMTLIATQRSKLDPGLSKFLYGKMLPMVYDDMKKNESKICPYVETYKETPDSGIVEFMETPRYMTGFASLFNCIGFVTESHMLKPYPQRVKATIEILRSILKQTAEKRATILMLRADADRATLQKKVFHFNWKLNEKKIALIDFKGYEAKFTDSRISGMQRLFYDREKPWTKMVPYFCNYTATDSASEPFRYVIPQAWKSVIEILKLNGVRMTELNKDTVLGCEVYYITDFKTGARPYEGHYVHSEIKTRTENQKIKFFKGDVLIDPDQPANRYIVEVLEPRSEDSFFAWGFFDAILGQKEWFSDYVFEEVAEKILQESGEIKMELEKAKITDKNLAKDHWGQLNFIFQHSKYKERSHNRYPVYRLKEM